MLGATLACRGFYGASRWLKVGIEERPCLLWRERSLLF
nr:MAG TPA: hypothetical protein [Caudoviricetes sp.]